MSTSQHSGADALGRLAALGEPIRRSLYGFVAGQDSPVSRDQAAQGVGVARHVAKFHLDKLVEGGLLEAHYRRPAGRTGPGAGRPTKLYRRADAEIALSLPQRRYDLAADILARAVADAQRTGEPVGDALHRVARQTGAGLARPDTDSGSHGDAAAALCDLLGDHGYEPAAADVEGQARQIVLRNCPFHRLAQAHTDLVCGLNLDLLGGLTDASPDSGLHAKLDPGPGRCCVTLVPRPEAATR